MIQTTSPPRTRKQRPPVEPLRAEDFRRLGLELSESRVGVIRRAARQSSASVVTRSHAEGTGFPHSEAELSRVVASTYRLLDPRRRAELVERVQLVRAEPTPVRTWLWGDASQAGVVEEENRAAAEDQREDDWMLAMLADLRTDPLPANGGGPKRSERQRSSHLDSRGLPGLYELASLQLARLLGSGGGRPVSQRIAFAVVGGLLAGLCLAGLIKVTAPSPLDRQLDPSSLNSTADLEPAVGGSGPVVADVQRVGAAEAERELPSQELEAIAQIPQVIEPPVEDTAQTLEEIEQAGLDHPPRSTADSRAPALPPALPQTALPQAALTQDVAAEMSSESSDASPSATVGETVARNPAGPRDLSTDLTAEAVRPVGVGGETIESSETLLADVPPGLLDGGVNGELARPVRHPLPTEDQLAAASQKLRETLIGDATALAGGVRLAERLWSEQLQHPAGSAERIVKALVAGEQMILVGRPEVAWEVAEAMTKDIEVEWSELAFRMLDASASRAVTLTERERVCQWALRVSERALVEDAYQLASDAARVGTQVAVDTKNAELRDRFKQRRDAISAAERMSLLSAEVQSKAGAETAEMRDAGAVGRHLCMNLRQWELGLPWLAVAGISRVSKCAQDEVLWQQQGSATALADLAHDWIEAAEAQRSGRLMDSMMLHARDLLVKATELSTGLERLEVEKELRDLDVRLPEDLLPLSLEEGRRWLTFGTAGTPAVNDQPPSTSVGAPSRPLVSSQSDIDSRTLGALARLTVNGEPTGVGIRYAPRIPLPRMAIDQVLDLQQLPHGFVELETQAFLAVTEPTTLRVTIRGPGLEQLGADSQVSVGGVQPANVGQLPAGQVAGMSLTLDDQPVRWLPLDERPAVERVSIMDVPVGLYRVVWKVSGHDFPPCQLVFHDDRTGAVIPLRHDDVSRQAVTRTPVLRWAVIQTR